MTFEEKILMLKVMSDEKSDEVLAAYLAIAKGVILNKAFPYGGGADEVPPQYDKLQVEIASDLIAKRGAEGETAHTENGVGRTYENAHVSDSLLRRIIPTVGVV